MMSSFNTTVEESSKVYDLITQVAIDRRCLVVVGKAAEDDIDIPTEVHDSRGWRRSTLDIHSHHESQSGILNLLTALAWNKSRPVHP